MLPVAAAGADVAVYDWTQRLAESFRANEMMREEAVARLKGLRATLTADCQRAVAILKRRLLGVSGLLMTQRIVIAAWLLIHSRASIAGLLAFLIHICRVLLALAV